MELTCPGEQVMATGCAVRPHLQLTCAAPYPTTLITHTQLCDSLPVITCSTRRSEVCVCVCVCVHGDDITMELSNANKTCCLSCSGSVWGRRAME